jgi:hypothetical protein
VADDERAQLLVADISQVLAEYDSEGLIRIGAPADEYEPEARELARVAMAGSPITVDVLADLFHRWFGPAARLPRKPEAQLARLATTIDEMAQRYAA